MQTTLFPDGKHLPIVRRIAYRAFIVAGAVTLFFVLFAVALDIITDPRANSRSIAIALASAIIAAGHVIWESCTARRLSAWRWLAFLVALGAFSYETWININDPTAKRMLVAMMGGSGMSLLIGRILLVTYAPAMLGDVGSEITGRGRTVEAGQSEGWSGRTLGRGR